MVAAGSTNVRRPWVTASSMGDMFGMPRIMYDDGDIIMKGPGLRSKLGENGVSLAALGDADTWPVVGTTAGVAPYPGGEQNGVYPPRPDKLLAGRNGVMTGSTL